MLYSFQDTDNVLFVDSSPLKQAAMDLEIKLKGYQSKIGASPIKKHSVSYNLICLMAPRICHEH